MGFKLNQIFGENVLMTKTLNSCLGILCLSVGLTLENQKTANLLFSMLRWSGCTGCLPRHLCWRCSSCIFLTRIIMDIYRILESSLNRAELSRVMDQTVTKYLKLKRPWESRRGRRGQIADMAGEAERSEEVSQRFNVCPVLPLTWRFTQRNPPPVILHTPPNWPWCDLWKQKGAVWAGIIRGPALRVTAQCDSLPESSFLPESCNS